MTPPRTVSERLDALAEEVRGLRRYAGATAETVRTVEQQLGAMGLRAKHETLTVVPGAGQAYALQFEPWPESEKVYVGVLLEHNVEYTVAGQTLTVLNELDADDFLRVHYWYVDGEVQLHGNVGEADSGSFVLAEGDEWSYAQGLANTPATYAAVGFDDSAWSVGPSIFGWNGTPSPFATTVGGPGSPVALWLRKRIFTHGRQVDWEVLMDNAGTVYLDGVQIWTGSAFGVYTAFSTTPSAGDHVLAVRCDGDGLNADYVSLAGVEVPPP